MKSSPFDLFRRNQTEFMVVLTLLSIFAFVFIDSGQRRSGEMSMTLEIAMIALFVGGALWWLGRSRGQGTEFGLWGLLIGGLVGYIGLSAQHRGPAVITTGSGLTVSRETLHRLSVRRSYANQFLQRVMQKTGMNQQMAGFGEVTDQSLANAYILEQDAKKLGIKVSDKRVVEFLKRVTSQRLTSSDFKEVIADLGIGEGEIFRYLREELEGNLAAVLTQPSRSTTRKYLDFQAGFQTLSQPFPATPAQYWDYFRKLKVKQEMTVVALPVKAFEAVVPEPTEKELLDFFDKNKGKASGGADFTPGFLQPRKVSLAWISADVEEFEKQVKKPTEDQLKAYYDSHKSKYVFRENDPLEKEDTTKKPDSDPAKDGEKKPSGDQPAPEKKTAPETKADPEKKPEPASKTEGDQKPEGEKPADPKPESKPEEKKPAEAPNANRLAKTGVIRLASFADEAKAEEKKADQKADAKTEKAEETPPGEKKEPAPALPKVDSGEVINKTLPIEGLPEVKKEPRQKTFEEAREEVEEDYLQERAFELVGNALEEIVDELDKISDKYQSETDSKAQDKIRGEYIATAQDLAQRKGLTYQETKALSMEQLFERKNGKEVFPIATATEVSFANNPAARMPGVAQLAFMQTTLFAPRRADSGDNRFLWWRTADIPPREPKFADVKDEVLEGYRFVKARELAQKRGEELKAAIEKAKGDFPAALDGTTITGEKSKDDKKDDLAVITETNSFSWLTTGSSVPQHQLGGMQVPRLSEIGGVQGADGNFMKKVFDELKVHEVGVCPNFDRSVYYVVQVKSRTDLNPEDETLKKAFRNEFLQELLNQFRADNQQNFFAMQQTPYDILADQDFSNLERNWNRRASEKFSINSASK